MPIECIADHESIATEALQRAEPRPGTVSATCPGGDAQLRPGDAVARSERTDRADSSVSNRLSELLIAERDRTGSWLNHAAQRDAGDGYSVNASPLAVGVMHR